jgi:hypothetical protein
MVKLIPVPEAIESAWRAAPPGREAAAVNEAMRAVRSALAPAGDPPRWVGRRPKLACSLA